MAEPSSFSSTATSNWRVRKTEAKQTADDLVDPELAAAVIRDYLLPLFEEGSKPIHNAKARAGRMTEASLANTSGSILHSATSSVFHSQDSCGRRSPGTSMLEEMLLSTKLLREITEARETITSLEDKLETSEFERSGMKEKYTASRKKVQAASREMRLMKFNSEAYREKSEELEAECRGLRSQLEDMTQEMKKTAEASAKLSKKLFDTEREVESLSRRLLEKDNLGNMAKLQAEVLGEQVRALHKAAQELGGVKECQDRLRHVEEMAAIRVSQITEFKDELEIETARVVDERNALQEKVEELTASQDRLSLARARLQTELEEQKKKATAQMIDLFEEKNAIRKERDKMEKKTKDLQEDRDKLRQRLRKYHARRRLFEMEHRTCKNCNKEYMESVNFNWSCRTHQSEFGGEMWWCCGKSGKDATGCKFAKHESKDDEEDYDDLLDADENGDGKEGGKKKKSMQNVKCFSCKEMGHKSEMCPRDPNLRSFTGGFMPTKELRRIEILQTAAATGGGRRGGITAIDPGNQKEEYSSEQVVKIVNNHLGYQAVELISEEHELRLFEELRSGLDTKVNERKDALGVKDDVADTDSSSGFSDDISTTRAQGPDEV